MDTSKSTKTNFIILCGPRTGSSAIRLWLNSHAQIRCHDEVLHKNLDTPDGINHYTQVHFPNIDYAEAGLQYADNPQANQLLDAYLTSLYTNPKHSAPWGHFDDRRKLFNTNQTFHSEGAVGFKFMYYLLHSQFLKQWIKSDSVKILHLTRDNTVKQCLSYLVAKESSLYHSEHETSNTKLTINTTDFRNMLDYLADGTGDIHQQYSGKNYLRFTYESFCAQPEILSEKITNFLGVEKGNMSLPETKKLNSNNVEDIVNNYDELVISLEGSRFQKMIT